LIFTRRNYWTTIYYTVW